VQSIQGRDTNLVQHVLPRAVQRRLHRRTHASQPRRHRVARIALRDALLGVCCGSLVRRAEATEERRHADAQQAVATTLRLEQPLPSLAL
jgi:hypothetical protein